MIRLPLLLLTALSTLLIGAGPVASPQPQPPTRSLREAVQRNEIVPLKTLMDWIDEHYVGQVVEVELDSESGEFGYEVDLLTPEGAKLEFHFDARSGELLSVSGKDIEKARRK
jgi:hypothetical protein